MVGDTCSSCQCWAWRRHCCSNSALRHGLGTSAKECLLPVSSARACTDCFESPLCSQASPSNALLHFPPTLPALQHPCSSTASSCPILPSVSCKNHCLCRAFYSCSQPVLFFPCLVEHSHAILPLAPAEKHRAHVWRLLQQTCCFHHDAVPWSCTATIADLPLLSSLVWRPGPPKHQDLLFSNFRQVL